MKSYFVHINMFYIIFNNFNKIEIHILLLLYDVIFKYRKYNFNIRNLYI